MKDVESYKSFNSSDVDRKLNAVSNQIDLYSNLRGDDKKNAYDYMRKILYTNHGTRHEDTTASHYDDLEIDDTFYTYDVCSLEGTVYQIVGRIDRVRQNYDGTKTIIEIKNRSRGLFKTVRDYEDIQCQTYMEMMDLNTCNLIEQYNDSRMGYEIRRDRKKWLSEIRPKIIGFCEYFHSLLSK